MKMKQKSIGYPITKKVLVMTLILMSFIGMAGSVQAEEEEIVINVAPSTLVMDDSGRWVIVHTNIEYDAEWDSLLLNGFEPYETKDDECGFLVAKFIQADIKTAIQDGTISVEDGEVTLKLTGTLNGVEFSAEDTIRVIMSGKK